MTTASPAPTAQAPRASTNDAPSTIGGLVRTMVTRASPLILMTLLGGFGACRLWKGDWSWVDAAVVGGLIAWWPFQEWLIHTYMLHFRPRKLGPITIDFAQAQKHRRHHRRPWDFAEISIPLRTYVTTVPILCGVAYAGWDVPAVLTGITAFCALSLHYEWCHFMAHSNYVPKSRVYKTVWKNHRLHHFKNETQWMGVSTRLGDRVLGTCPEQKAVPKSATCLTLGVGA